MTDLDEEARRLAAAHPWAGTATETHRTDWQPQHAVPRRPAPYRPTDETIELQVAADLARIDRELDPQAPPPVFGTLLRLEGDAGVGPDYFAAHDAMLGLARRMQAAYARSRAYVVDPALVHIEEDDFDTIDATQWNAIQRHSAKLARLTFSYTTGAPSFRITEDEADRYRKPKQRTPKTYVAPGRKAGRTWIARLEQSKQARKR